MNNGFVHNIVLLIPVAAYFRQLGADVRWEHPVSCNSFTGYVDLVVDFNGWRLACEAEMSSRRIDRDVVKAKAIGAAALGIVTPTGRVAQACRRKLRRLEQPGGLWISVLTPGGFRRWVEDSLIRYSRSELRVSTF